MIFRMICNEVKVELYQATSQQPDPLIALLPRTDDYSLSCSDMLLPNLIIDEDFTLAPPLSPITQDITVLPTESTMNVVRQKMRTSTDEHVSGSLVVIDDVLLHSTSLILCLILLEYYMRVYFKYRESFKLGKCDFLSERFEFIGRNIMPTGNTTTTSKYDLITDWKLPTIAAGLHSFVSLVNFYKRSVLFLK